MKKYLFRFSLIYVSVITCFYCKAQDVVFQKKLDNKFELSYEDQYNPYHEPNLGYFFIEDKGILRREVNQLQFYNFEFEKKWEHQLDALSGGKSFKDNLFRITFSDKYIFMAYYTINDNPDQQKISLAKINIMDGIMEQMKLTYDGQVRDIDYMIYRNGMIYLFCKPCYSCDIWDYLYESYIIVLNTNFEIENKFSLPINPEGGSGEINWIFTGATSEHFTYESFYTFKKGKATNAYSSWIELRNEKKTFNYDFELVEHTIKDINKRPDCHRNPVKYDTNKFVIYSPWRMNYSTFTRTDYFQKTDPTNTATFYYKNYYPRIPSILVNNKSSDKSNDVLADFRNLINAGKPTKGRYWRLIDAVGDPLNNSISFVVMFKHLKSNVYSIILNENLEVCAVYKFQVKSPDVWNKHDYNYSVAIKKSKKSWINPDQTYIKNSFDYIFEHGEGMICSVVNDKNCQYVFIDDPIKGESNVIVIGK